MASEIIRRFVLSDPSASLEPDVLAELESAARMHHLSAEDMFYKWDAYCMKRDVDSTDVTLVLVRAFKQDLQDALDKQTRLAKGGSAAGGGLIMPAAGATLRGRDVAGGDVFGMCVGCFLVLFKTISLSLSDRTIQARWSRTQHARHPKNQPSQPFEQRPPQTLEHTVKILL